MLLYDALIEHALQYKKHNRLREVDSVTLKTLHQATVYEVTNVVPLAWDWDLERTKAIPRDPPQDITWVEWSNAEQRFGPNKWSRGVVETIGVLIFPVDEDACPPGSQESVKALGARRLYFAESFCRRETCSPDSLVSAAQDNNISFKEAQRRWDIVRKEIYVGACFVMGIRDDLTCDTLMWKSKSPLGLRNAVDLFEMGLDSAHFLSPDPAFMAFSLLHCKNIVTEDQHPDPVKQRHVVKRGGEPRVIYKVLKVMVPKTKHGRPLALGGDADAGPKMRFHLCSGHFKNLQHERFVNKGWHWWPAHWRGSRALGKVVKTYQLEGADK